MQPVANAHSTQCGTGRRGHQVHHLSRDQKRSARGLQAARRKLRNLPRWTAARVSIGGARLGRRDGSRRRPVPVSGLGCELARDPEIASVSLWWGVPKARLEPWGPNRGRPILRDGRNAAKLAQAALTCLRAPSSGWGGGPRPASPLLKFNAGMTNPWQGSPD